MTAADETRIAVEHWFARSENAVIIAPEFFKSKSTGTLTIGIIPRNWAATEGGTIMP